MIKLQNGNAQELWLLQNRHMVTLLGKSGESSFFQTSREDEESDGIEDELRQLC